MIGSQSSYKGGKVCDVFLHFIAWKQSFRWLWGAILDSWRPDASFDTSLAKMWHSYMGECHQSEQKSVAVMTD